MRWLQPMYDLLYFNTVPVSLEDIASVATQEGYKVEHGQTECCGPYLEVYHGGMLYGGDTTHPQLQRDRWIFDYTDVEAYDIEDDWALVEAYRPACFLSAQYHVGHLCDLTKFLRRLMDVYGGRVYGADNKIHDAATIERMQFITGDGEVYLECGNEQ